MRLTRNQIKSHQSKYSKLLLYVEKKKIGLTSLSI